MNVSILDDYGDVLRTLDCFRRLAGHDVTVWNDHVDDLDVLARRLEHTEALVLIRERTAVPAALVERLPALRLISQRSAFPHIDVAACTRHGVIVSSNLHADAPSYAAAELTWALILAAMRQIPQQMASLKRGEWQRGLGQTLRGKTLAIYGYGRIGATVAHYGRAFGMRVLAWGGDRSRQRAAKDGIEFAPDRHALFERADVLSLHVRLVPATRHTVTLDDLSLMKPTSLFLNTSRAGLVAPGALPAALRAGRPGMSALDVYEHEPIRSIDDPLLSFETSVFTPHIGFVTRDEFELQFADVFEQVCAYDRGEPCNVVNPDVLGRVAAQLAARRASS